MNERTNDLISITPKHFPEVAFKEPNAQAGPGTRLNKPLAPKPDQTKQSQRLQSGSPSHFLSPCPICTNRPQKRDSDLASACLSTLLVTFAKTHIPSLL